MNSRLLASDIFGEITNPWGPGALDVPYPTAGGGGLLALFNNLLKLIVVVAGLFSFINIIIAGYGFMSAGGNPEKVAAAWNKIWQSLLGLLVVGASFILAAVFGWLIFGDPTAIINPTIYGPQ